MQQNRSGLVHPVRRLYPACRFRHGRRVKRIAVLLAVLAATSLFAAPPAFDPFDEKTEIEEIGVAVAGFKQDKGAEQLFSPEDDHGHDDATGATVESRNARGGRGTFMHPPYNGGPGVTFREFTVRLPAVTPGFLAGETALTEGAEKSDGVTFSVLVNGERAWSEHRTGQVWQVFRVDLARWTGQVATIRFEVSPGPRNNTGFDWAMWRECTLNLPGHRAAPRPDPLPLDIAPLGSTRNGSWAPLSGFKMRHTVALDDRTATLKATGADGDLVYTWKLPAPTDASTLGSFTLQATMNGDRPVEIQFARNAVITWTDPVKPDGATIRKRGEAIELVRTFRREDGAAATLTASASLAGKSLVLSLACDQPWIKSVSPGDWGPVAVRRRVAVPYYGHDVEFLPAENLFVCRYPDWTRSAASHFSGATALYRELTDGSRHAMKETFIFAAGWHLAEAFANIPNPASPYRKEMGARTVLDIWDWQTFDVSARDLDLIGGLGVRDGFIIYHAWQRDGYDNGLPAHWPAREKQGGEPAMKQLSATAKRLGHLFSLHENYVDYYPNYEHFTTNDLSHNSTGGIEKAWLNEGTGIQSFAIKPSAILRLAKEQSPEIKKRYDTTAGYLDVHSCVPMWFHVDMQAGVPGAGSLQSVIEAHHALWQYGRDVHEGPMTGEGNNHWMWSGWLDGVEAQFGTGWGHNSGRTAPLLVDFNLLRIHPLQLNHGQGYYNRWADEPPPWGGGMPMVALDQYRMQEVIFGHAAFLGASHWRKPGFAWLEHHLVGPVVARHATDTIREIRYWVGGRWVDATAAAKVGRFTRTRVTWTGGLTLTANGEAGDFECDGEVLPEFGWLATAKDFKAGTVRRGGAFVDVVESPDLYLANARRARDWFADAPLPVRVEVADFQALENRRIRFSYHWKSDTKLDEDYRCFVHFDQPEKSRDKWKTVMQQDHALRVPTSAWTNGETFVDGAHEVRVPDGLPDGRYAWFIGLFNATRRVSIDGDDDGQSRIRLGDVVVTNNGTKIAFEHALPDGGATRPEWFRRNLNVDARVIDFGFVRTDGAVSFKREGKTWRQITWPAKPDFTLEINRERIRGELVTGP